MTQRVENQGTKIPSMLWVNWRQPESASKRLQFVLEFLDPELDIWKRVSLLPSEDTAEEMVESYAEFIRDHPSQAKYDYRVVQRVTKVHVTDTIVATTEL